MTSLTVLILFFLTAAAAAKRDGGGEIVRTGAETSQRVGNGERVDLSAEGTGSDYPKQFGTLRNAPLYAQHHGHYSNHWSPYHPQRPFYYNNQDQTRIDPYVLHLFTRYARFLPQGLGLYGIYGSTGLPHVKPPGVFSFPHADK